MKKDNLNNTTSLDMRVIWEITKNILLVSIMQQFCSDEYYLFIHISDVSYFCVKRNFYRNS